MSRFSVSAVSRFSGRHSDGHWDAVRGIFRYLAGSTTRCITYGGVPGCGDDVVNLFGFSDADWGGQLGTRRSTTGYVFFVHGGPVSWTSKTQPSVALSSAEAEYMAAAAAAQEAVWLRALLDQLGFPQKQPTVIFEDNQSCIAMSGNPVFHKRTKHIELRHHFIRERVLSGEIKLQYCHTSAQVADLC